MLAGTRADACEKKNIRNMLHGNTIAFFSLFILYLQGAFQIYYYIIFLLTIKYIQNDSRAGAGFIYVLGKKNTFNKYNILYLINVLYVTQFIDCSKDNIWSI